MQKLFNNILVPVDFSRTSKRAFEKAIDLANKYECNIHLLHVVSISPMTAMAMAEGHVFVPYGIIDNQKELEFQLENLKHRYESQLEKKNTIYTHFQKGLWDESIIDFVQHNKIDLVVIGLQGKGLHKKRSIFNANKIAEKINIPVITVPINRRLIRLISVVIPITDFLPVKKLMYGVYVAQNDNATIRLLGVEDENDPDQCRKVQHYLRKSFQLIRDNCTVPVEIATTSGRNVAEAINQYTFKNPMDLIIVNPGKQSRMPGLLSSFLGNFIQKFSAPPVLTVSSV
jgi:nucleotide-binding universal stress UspA family protein